MSFIGGILGAVPWRPLLCAAGVTAVLAASYHYLKQTTEEEETAVTPVERDRHTLKELQAEAEVIVRTVLCDSILEVYSHQEEDQASHIMDGAAEAPRLLDTDLAKVVEAEITVHPELCESVMETVVEDGGVNSPQEEDQASHIIDGAAEDPRLVRDTDLAEVEVAEIKDATSAETETKADSEQPVNNVDLVTTNLSSDEASPTKKWKRRRGTRGKGRKIFYRKDNGEERRSQSETTQS